MVRESPSKQRCPWSTSDPLYVAYHDTEWGFPVRDDQRLFEKIALEAFQSGLSWLTILKKRESFRAAFESFDIAKVARFTPKRVERLLLDEGIVRHRGKIESTIENAQRCCDLIDEVGSLSDYVWRYEPAAKTRPERLTWDVLKTVTETPESVALSKDLKTRGWRFVGPTTMYAFMQSMGLVNDHVDECFVRPLAARARR